MIGDSYSSKEAQFDDGDKELIVDKIEFVIAKTEKRTEGLKVYFLFGPNYEFKINKTFWESGFFNRNISALLVALSLNPDDLDAASKEKRFKQWLEAKLPGRHGTFWCEKGEPNDDGKRYLQVMTKAETDYAEWKKSQNGVGSAPGVPSPEPGKNDGTPPDFPDDIPFSGVVN